VNNLNEEIFIVKCGDILSRVQDSFYNTKITAGEYEYIKKRFIHNLSIVRFGLLDAAIEDMLEARADNVPMP